MVPLHNLQRHPISPAGWRGSSQAKKTWDTRPGSSQLTPSMPKVVLRHQNLDESWGDCHLSVFSVFIYKCNQTAIAHEGKRHFHLLEDSGDAFNSSIQRLKVAWISTCVLKLISTNWVLHLLSGSCQHPILASGAHAVAGSWLLESPLYAWEKSGTNGSGGGVLVCNIHPRHNSFFACSRLRSPLDVELEDVDEHVEEHVEDSDVVEELHDDSLPSDDSWHRLNIRAASGCNWEFHMQLGRVSVYLGSPYISLHLILYILYYIAIDHYMLFFNYTPPWD